MISLLYKLFDAFAELIEPLIARLMLRRRWVVAQEGEGFGFYEVVGSRVILRARSDSDEKALRIFRRASGGLVELRIRDDQVLHRMLRLPQAGRDFLEPIIEHRLERLVPWRPERVLYGFRAVGDVDANGSLAVEFAATSEDAVSELLKHLDALKLTPTALGTTAQVLTAPPSIDLYRGRRSAARLHARRILSISLAAILLVLLPACIGSFWLAFDRMRQLRATEERLQTTRGVLAAASTGLAQERDRTLIAAKRRETSIIILIARLSAAIPMNTFLRELEIDHDKVRLVGFSGDAPGLIPLVEKEGLLNVRFAAPVIRDEERRDGFDLVAGRSPSGTGAQRP